MIERVEDRLRPGGLDVLSSGLNLAELDLAGGDGFWPEVQRYTRLSLLERQVDLMMSGRSAPRVWAFLEAPGAGAAAAAAALGVARILADRGQAVVLVDADEQDPLVTRWLGRTEQEGWIDMVRFGASLHAASVPLPSDARRGSVVGVGSFAPTGVTPDEVADLLARLRRQADDLILVLPAKLRSVPWLELAQIRLLCWDLLGRGAGDTETILVELERMGAKPDALLGFGVEEFVAIQGRLREQDVAAVAAAPDAADTPDAPAAAGVPAFAPPPEAEPQPAPESPPTPAFEHESAPEPAPLPLPDLAEEPAGSGAPTSPTTRQRTSRIFVVLAVAAVVCLALLAVFMRNQLDAGRDQIRPREPQVAEANVAPPPRAVEPATPEVTEPAAGQGDVGQEPAATPETGETTQPVADVPEPPTLPMPETTPEPTPEPTAAATPPPAVDPATFDWSPFQKPVGQDGWALWLYSFPDEAGAVEEARRLERRGLRAEVRAVELPDQGRWFRVYTGSFADRAGAREAAPLLIAELRHNWAQPARF